MTVSILVATTVTLFSASSVSLPLSFRKRKVLESPISSQNLTGFTMLRRSPRRRQVSVSVAAYM